IWSGGANRASESALNKRFVSLDCSEPRYTSLALPIEKNKKWSPSGRNWGKRWLACSRGLIVVTSVDSPPPAGMRLQAPVPAGAKRMMLPSPHDPPALPESASDRTPPPARSSRFNFRSAKKPSDRLSGDQKGRVACSVPAKGSALSESRERSQS